MRMMCVALAGVVLASCQLATNAEPGMIDQAKRLVRAGLPDPSAARFHDVRVVPQQMQADPAVCGRVSDRNGEVRNFYVVAGEAGLEPRPDGTGAIVPAQAANSWRSDFLRICTVGGGAMSPPPPGS